MRFYCLPSNNINRLSVQTFWSLRLFSSLSDHHYHTNVGYIFTLNIENVLLSRLSSATSQKNSEGELRAYNKEHNEAIKTGKSVIERRQSTFENRTMSKGFKQIFENSIIKVFHLLVAIHYFYALYYDFTYVLPKEIPLRNYSFGSKLVYLTVLNAVSRWCEIL